MSESENHQPEENTSIGTKEKLHGSHGIGAVVKQRPAVMEPLKVICNTSNGPTDGDMGLTNCVPNDTHKYQTPPCSPKQKEPRAKMSLSPNKTSAKLTNQNIDLAKAGIKRGYARKTMTPDRVLGPVVKLKSAMKPSPSNDSISTSPASSREGSVESIRSSVSLDANSKVNPENNNNKSEHENNTDDTRSEASSARSSPAKFPPRARKSLPKAGNGSVTLVGDCKPTNRLTFKITDFANKLGLQGHSLAKVDAKTLDQLIMKARKKDISRANSPAPTNKEKLNTPGNAVATVDSPIPKSSDIDDETGDSGRSTPSRSRMDSPSRARKKKKRKSGTYSLPSNKRIIKKRRSNPSESSLVDSDGHSASDKQSDNVAMVDDEADGDHEQIDSPMPEERLVAETESVEESVDTDDKDTGLSDETSSEKGTNDVY